MYKLNFCKYLEKVDILRFIVSVVSHVHVVFDTSVSAHICASSMVSESN